MSTLQVVNLQNPTSGIVNGSLNANGTTTFNGLVNFASGQTFPGAGGTVTSISGSGGTTGLTLTGGPITGSGTLTLGGILAIANGGTGASTAALALTALLPSQSGNPGKVLTTDGTTASWGSYLPLSGGTMTGNIIFASLQPLGNLQFLQPGTGAVTRTAQSKLQETASVKDFGAVGDGITDDTAAINAAINASNNVFIPPGTYRCDGTVTITSSYQNRKLVTMTAGTTLQRLSAYSATQDPVVALLGNYGKFDGGGGEIMSENPSPRGVAALGQQDVTGGTNGLYWSFANCDVRCKDYATVPASGATVGVYIPSSQPNEGSNSANYFGTVSNVRVFSASIAYFLTDIANAHTFVNCTIDSFWHYGWYLRGAYGNTIYGGFINGCLQNGGYAIYLGNKLLPSAPYAASHQSNNNNFFGATIELYSTGNFGVYIPAAVSGYDSAHNFVQMNWNSTGTAVTDLTGGTTNTIFDGLTTFRLGENLEMPDQTIAGYNLLKIGNSSYVNSHCIAKTPPAGAPVLIVENNATTSQPNVGIQIANNTPIIGFNSYQVYCYHTATASTVFAVLDNGDCRNTNNSYGAISDIKLKENIIDANSQWDDIKAIQVRNYNFKKGQTHKQIGVIAQEIELISPNLVNEIADRTEEGADLGTVTKTVNYSVLYMKAVKALQEAMERIETLETRLNDAGII